MKRTALALVLSSILVGVLLLLLFKPAVEMPQPLPNFAERPKLLDAPHRSGRAPVAADSSH